VDELRVWLLSSSGPRSTKIERCPVELAGMHTVEGTGQRLNHSTAHTYPTKIFIDFSKLPENSENFTKYEECFHYREYCVFSPLKVVALGSPKLKLSN